MTHGVFIAFEGIDGAGTTTQAQRLHRRLPNSHRTQQPSDRPVGVLLRQLLRGPSEMSADALALAFATDRLDHWTGEVRPILHNGQHVVCDRYLLSSYAYQSLDAPLEWIENINSMVGRPDLTFFLRVSSELAARRRAQRNTQPERFEQTDFQERVARRYETLLERDDVGPVVALDGSLSEDTIEDAVWSHVSAVLKSRSRV